MLSILFRTRVGSMSVISLLPGETREVTATYRTRDLGTEKPAVEVSGRNME